MTRPPSRSAPVCVLVLLSHFGFVQEVVTASTTIPFNCWAGGHEFQAGDYVFGNEDVQSSVWIYRAGTNSGFGVSIILYEVPEEKENPRVIFVRRDERYFLRGICGVQKRYVVTAEFEHRGEVSEEQRQTPLTIVEAHDR